MAAPGIQGLVNQADGLIGALDGKFAQAFGLLLWGQMAYDFNVAIKGAGTRGRHDGRRPGEGGGERRSKVKPTRRGNFKARGLITQKRGKNGGEWDEEDVKRPK